ncbi:MAG: outer membrane protein assembly factor BamD [Victivallales bacterium]|nr:outer membrane protein assembly factor BamD [Victivallales bacterium]
MSLRFIFMLLLAVSALAVCGADTQNAEARFQQGVKAYEQKDYMLAAENFSSARMLSDQRSMKVKALLREADSYRKAGFLKNEFMCIENLLKSYPSEVDYEKMVDREYAIGDEFFKGHRDPAYASLRWIPWLTGSNHTAEIYKCALDHAPFSDRAPVASLRLARMYIDQQHIKKAIDLLRKLTTDYPDSEARRYAFLELANALMYLARYGDGDGAYNREANEVMADYLRKYPDSKEADWVRKRILESRDINAERLYGLARYYNRVGKTEPAERYLNKVLREYPDSIPADKSEEMLSRLDNRFVPLSFRPEIEPREQEYVTESLPVEAQPIMIAPENSGGRWLLPVRDLGLDSTIKIDRSKIGKD